MTDLISRADAIEMAVDVETPQGTYERAIYVDDLMELPSAEAVQGEWTDIDDYYRMATCSCCHKVTMFEKWGEYTKPYDFCPNCGAMMMTKGGGSE